MEQWRQVVSIDYMNEAADALLPENYAELYTRDGRLQR